MFEWGLETPLAVGERASGFGGLLEKVLLFLRSAVSFRTLNRITNGLMGYAPGGPW